MCLLGLEMKAQWERPEVDMAQYWRKVYRVAPIEVKFLSGVEEP